MSETAMGPLRGRVRAIGRAGRKMNNDLCPTCEHPTHAASRCGAHGLINYGGSCFCHPGVESKVADVMQRHNITRDVAIGMLSRWAWEDNFTATYGRGIASLP